MLVSNSEGLEWDGELAAILTRADILIFFGAEVVLLDGKKKLP